MQVVCQNLGVVSLFGQTAFDNYHKGALRRNAKGHSLEVELLVGEFCNGCGKIRAENFACGIQIVLEIVQLRTLLGKFDVHPQFVGVAVGIFLQFFFYLLL